MEKKIYGAAGYMDYVVLLPVGAGKVRVHFTGGALTAYGVTPAEFTTDSPFIQRVIENSHYFKDGRITLLKTIKSAAPAKAAPTPAPTPEPATPDTEATEASTGLQQVEVTCLQDAQNYLTEHFGIAAYKVRTKPTVQAAAAEHGIEFVGL